MNKKIKNKKLLIILLAFIVITFNVKIVPAKALEVNSSGNLEASSNSEDEDIPLIKLSFSTSTSDDFSKIIGGSLSESDIHLNIPNIVSNKPVGAIGDNAFINNRNIISARIPNTVKYIGAGAFLSCENLEKVNMPESLETIGQSAFQATNISKVTFPETLVSIGCVAFGETPIESITIPASTTDIDGAAFAGSNLKEIKVAEGNEKYISENQMILTKDKSTIVCCAPTVTEPIFDSKCTVIGNNSFALSKIFTLNIPNGIKEIGISAFQGCESLSSVVLPKDLTEIKEQTFSGCDNLTSIVIPDTVKSIADDAFKYSDKVTIIASDESYAHKYANEKGILFRDIKEIDNPYKEKKAIIVIPGIAGSRLYNSKNDVVWEPTIMGSPIYSYSKIKNIENLGYDENGKSIQSVGPYTVTGSIVDQVDNANTIEVSDYGTESTYLNLISDLRKKYSDQYDDIVYFPYEWRDSNVNVEEKLKEYIDEKGYTNVTLIAHSMGGIIASKYIQEGNKDKVDKLITIGTPYFGAPKALYVFETGRFLDSYISDFVTADKFKKVVNTLPSVYELLPDKQYFQNYSYVTNSSGKNLNYNETKDYMLSKNWCFEKYLNNSESLYDSISVSNGIAVNDVDSYIIVGENVKTISKLKINGDNNIDKDAERDDDSDQYIDDMNYIDDIHITKKGDGTVPLVSSTMKGISINRKPYYIDNVEHSDLPSNSTVIKLVETILNGNGDNDSDVKKAQAGNKISRSIGDKTARGENKNLDAEKITKFTVSGDAKLQLTNSNGEVTGTSEDASKKKNSFYYCGKDNSKKILFLDEEEMKCNNEISVVSNSDGKINYSIETYNDNDTIEEYDFKNVAVSKDSKITCKKTDNNTMELKVNKDNNNEMYIETQNKNVVPNITQINKYTVKFVTEDGQNICDNQIIEEGKEATAPEAPLKEGYTFKGWNKSFDNVSENLVIKPIYEKNEADNISKDDKPTDEGDKIEEDDGKNSETSDQNNLILIMGIMVLVGGLLKNTKDTVKRL